MSSAVDPMLHTAALAALEAALNQALSLAPASRQDLNSLEDNIFALHCTSPTLSVFLHIDSDMVRLSGVYEGAVTTSVTGDVSDFTELASADDPTATLINGNLELDGDSAPLIELQKILSTLDMDWEAPLVDTLGDVAGHQLAQLLRHAFSWGKQASASINRQLSEFIHEEARLCPPRLELEDFYSDVNTLVQRVDRLQSRTDRLLQRLQKSQTEQG